MAKSSHKSSTRIGFWHKFTSCIIVGLQRQKSLLHFFLFVTTKDRSSFFFFSGSRQVHNKSATEKRLNRDEVRKTLTWQWRFNEASSVSANDDNAINNMIAWMTTNNFAACAAPTLGTGLCRNHHTNATCGQFRICLFPLKMKINQRYVHLAFSSKSWSLFSVLFYYRKISDGCFISLRALTSFLSGASKLFVAWITQRQLPVCTVRERNGF